MSNFCCDLLQDLGLEKSEENQKKILNSFMKEYKILKVREIFKQLALDNPNNDGYVMSIERTMDALGVGSRNTLSKMIECGQAPAHFRKTNAKKSPIMFSMIDVAEFLAG